MTLIRIALAAVLILPEAGAQVPQPTAPPAAPRPEDRRFAYVIDLAATVPLAPVVVPAGKMLEVGLANVPLSPQYRVVVTQKLPPVQTRPLVRAPMPAVALKSPGCVPLKAELDAALAESDEARLSVRMAAFDQHLARADCAPYERSMLAYVLQLVRPSLRESRTLRPHQTIAYTVERLGTVDTVARSWTVTFVGGVPDLGWKYPDEETFMVAAVAQDIAAMAALAAGAREPTDPVRVTSSAAGAGARSFRVEARTGRAPVIVEIKPVPHLWAPAAYVPFVKAVLGAPKRRGPAADAGSRSSLETLTDLRAEVIERENRRVSERLTRDPLDSAAHADAALVLAAFALREAAAEFSDTRPVLSRMAAHLALAQALRGSAAATPAGRMAEVALDTLVSRQVPALEALSRIEAARPSAAEAAWTRALSMRNHGDWRVLARPGKATLLERIMFFHAAARADSPSRALLYFEETPLERLPDWNRIVLSRAFSVEEGHQFTPRAAELERADLDAVWRVSHQAPATQDELRSALASQPGGAVHGRQIRVLDWADWGAMAARHIHSANEATDYFLRHLWGVPERADAFAQTVDREFGSLPLHALVRQRRQVGSDPSLCDSMNRLVHDAPERLTASNWDAAFRWCGHVAGLPTYAGWFGPAVPTGTAYDASRRLLAAEIALDVPLEGAESMRGLAPYDTNVLLAYLGRKYGDRVDSAVAFQEFGKQSEYQLSAMRTLLGWSKNDPARRRELLDQMCARSADSCIPLGLELETSDPAGAERAYGRAVAEALDRVYVAASVQWLVDRYHDTGRGDEAMQVARMAADTYSRNGLQTMARYLERLDRFDEAATYYQRIADRYADPLEVDAFFVKNRLRLDQKRYGARVAEAVARVFPDGLQKVTLADFREPAEGARLVHQTDPVAAWGLKEGDVIVALDGYRVKTHHQYGAIKGWSTDPKMRLIVYDGRAYKEIEGERARIVYFRVATP